MSRKADLQVKLKSAEDPTFTFGQTTEDFSDMMSIVSLLFGGIAMFLKVFIFIVSIDLTTSL